MTNQENSAPVLRISGSDVVVPVFRTRAVRSRTVVGWLTSSRGALAARCLVASAVLLACTEEVNSLRPSQRSDRVLRTGWRFRPQYVPIAKDLALDDSIWNSITVPLKLNGLDGQDGGDNYLRAPTWYRTHIEGSRKQKGQRRYLQFDGANTTAVLYVNGRRINEHRGGFAAFRFDITDALHDGDNLIAVRVDNSPALDIPPLSADFTSFGGLYREVHLLTVNDLHIDLDDAGSSGVYLSTRDVSASGAELSARVRVTNASAEARDPGVKIVIRDADAAEVATLEDALAVPPGQTGELTLTRHIDNPHLWQGRQDPYLYTAQVELLQDGIRTDYVEQQFGFRSFGLDPNTGFSLNGEALDLHGVNRHQDRIDRGWAIGKAEHDEDMALILQLGANAVRLAHYQQASYFYDLCDSNGLVVWAEIPLVDSISDRPGFADNARQQLRELIRQNYNHPSILFWGIGNEQRMDDTPTNELLSELANLVDTEDPGRLSTYAHCCGATTANLVSHADTTGYNVYYGWYMGTTAQFGAFADQVHAARPSSPFAISEYGAGAGLSQHQDPPAAPVPEGMFHPEEYQAQLHEETWAQMTTRPFLWGKFIWNMFDFAVDGRNEGDTPGRNDKGLVSYDRLTKKDAFFYYQANWTTEPMVHIAGRRNQMRGGPIDIKVYSNAAAVQLTVNGVQLAAPSSSAGHVFRWLQVPLGPGDNQVEAQAISEGNAIVASDTVVWTRQ
jgi:beta-galactosidase